jgi:hypothetical protein
LIDGNGEVIDYEGPDDTIRALESALARLQRSHDALVRDKHAERKQHPDRALIEDVFQDWQERTGRKRSKLTDDRFDAIKCLVEKGYTRRHFELVNLALAAYPFERYGQRYADGAQLAEMELHDDLPDSFDLGYMTAWREIKAWMEKEPWR